MSTRVEAVPKDMSFSKLKEIVGVLMSILGEVYVDPLGKLIGIANQPFFVSTITVSDPIFMKYFSDKYVDLINLYKIISLPKSKVECVYDNKTGDIISMNQIGDPENKVVILPLTPEDVPNSEVLFEKYDEYKGIFENGYEPEYTIDETTDPSIKDFEYAMSTVYVYDTNLGFPITREMVPKPKRVKKVMYGKACEDDPDSEFLLWKVRLEYDYIVVNLVLKTVKL